MSFFDQVPPNRESSDPRVVAWNRQKVHTHADASYGQKARQAQDAASKSFATNIRTSQASQGLLQANKPKNTYTSIMGQSSLRANGRDQSLSSNNGPRSSSQWSGNTPTGPTDFTKNAPAGLNSQAASTPKSNENKLPPHLRCPGVNTQDSVTSATKSSKHGTRAPPKMNAGLAAKSAKLASNFPCTYEDCTLGFENEKAMKKHKEEDHDYCRPCDKDFMDFDNYFFHKLDSIDHICCCVCGQDFRSEGGRDRHERHAHSTQQECKCVGCGHVFDKGSALIQHIHENQCRDRDNTVSKRMNRETLKMSRAQASLHLDALSHVPSNTSKLIADMQPPDDDGSSIGGVRLDSPHLLDGQEPMEGTVAKNPDGGKGNDGMGNNLMEFSDSGSATPPKKLNRDFPTLGESAALKNKKEQSVIDGFGALTVNNNHHSTEWGTALVPGPGPNTTTGQGTGVTMIDYREAILPGNEGKDLRVATDWDHMSFKRHALDGYYHCPFARCKVISPEINDLKRHLTSGYHQGTDHRCLKCLKIFKTAAALIAHMESNSERCKIRETEHFPQILSVVSGGFLGVKGRNADGSIKIAALDEEELAEQTREQRELMPGEEDQSVDWNNA